ncbi:hypothetical protein BBD42_30085 [Paenibacillus sp. BIHB 4019]|uniref:DUF1871 domain-containing protein n=1 Tax=Paenibacillus sp. BIHB 4019 TaxID=1870819 RepID=A0A1B2DRC7_9BACL|nr:DUF1871 family protein [Paenibacillus sp. BIHB 4019]ANY70272.1 hypothetical protein BBD42_30085 [Paenibacillus sp. BIHB 4019]
MDKLRIIEACVNHWDPVGLFPGAPANEYSSEIRMIYAALEGCASAAQLAEHIQDVFQKHFDRQFDAIDCLRAASEIWRCCSLWE